MPKISVLMGIFNCADTLRQAVRSIEEQTYKDWELILCDDGSNDETFLIAQALAGEDSRIRVIQNKYNLGLAATLNRCLELAQGDFVARMDGDDLCPPDRFAVELRYLEDHPECAMVSGWMECFDESGPYGLIRYIEIPKEKDLIRGSQFCHAGCMMRAAVLRELNGYSTSESTARVEDYDLWVRMYAAGYRGYNFQRVLYQMRDDHNAYKRRKFRYRVNESRVSYRAFRQFHAPVSELYYAALPLIKGLVPKFIYSYFHAQNIKE